MVDKKITALTELTSPADADLLVIVDDVVGTATTKKVTMANIGSLIDHVAIQNIGTNAHSVIDTHVDGDGSDHADVSTNTSDITTISGAGYTNTQDILTVSGAGYANTLASHTQGTDTALGTMAEDINMNNSFQIVNLQAPANAGEAIRQTVKITEANMEAADDHVGGDGSDHADVATNTLKDTNVTTNLSLGVGNATTEIIVSSDGTDATLIEADTDNAGLLGADKWDEIVANTLKDTNVTTNITVVEAPTNVDIQSSDGSNDTIAAADVTNAGVMTTSMYDEHVLAVSHYGDNTQAHTDYLLNSANDSTAGSISALGFSLTGDYTGSVTSVVRNILIGSGTAPTASSYPQGTIYVQYTA